MSINYYEKEIIRLTAVESKRFGELHEFLKKRGFKHEGDFYIIDRLDTPKPWQAISILTLNVFGQGSSVHKNEENIVGQSGEWDELKVDYLLATLPAFYIEKCAIECEALAIQFDLKIELNGVSIKLGQLQAALQQIADKLTSEWDEPGSEIIGILIEQSYGR